MILQVTYQRVYRLGQYESERLEAVALVNEGDVQAAWDEAVAAVESEHARLTAERAATLNGNAMPKTAAEAESRFFRRYGATVGGNGWRDVQRFLGKDYPKPETVEGWIAAAEAVRDRPKQQENGKRTLPENW